MQTEAEEAKPSHAAEAGPGKRLIVACDGKKAARIIILLLNRSNHFSRHMDGMLTLP